MARVRTSWVLLGVTLVVMGFNPLILFLSPADDTGLLVRGGGEGGLRGRAAYMRGRGGYKDPLDLPDATILKDREKLTDGMRPREHDSGKYKKKFKNMDPFAAKPSAGKVHQENSNAAKIAAGILPIPEDREKAVQEPPEEQVAAGGSGGVMARRPAKKSRAERRREEGAALAADSARRAEEEERQRRAAAAAELLRAEEVQEEDKASAARGPALHLDLPALDPGLGAVYNATMFGGLRSEQPLTSKENFFWHPWAVRHEEQYFIFYLGTNLQWGEPWEVRGNVRQAISYDLESVQDRGFALRPLESPPWQSGRMMGGSAISRGGLMYLYYTAASINAPLVEHIGLAKSRDGENWERLPLRTMRSEAGNFVKTLVPLVEPNSDWYDTEATVMGKPSFPNKAGHVQWRDPHVVEFSDESSNTGAYYMYISASCAHLDSRWRACVGLAKGMSPEGPFKVLPPALIPLVPEEDRGFEKKDESLFLAIDRPSVTFHRGRYYMLVSSDVKTRNPRWSAVKKPQYVHVRVFLFTSLSPQGPFLPSSGSAVPTVGKSVRTGLYGIQLLPSPAAAVRAEGREAGGREEGEAEEDQYDDLVAIGGYDFREHPAWEEKPSRV